MLLKLAKTWLFGTMLFYPALILAHESDSVIIDSASIADRVTSLSVFLIIAAAIIIAVLVLVALFLREQTGRQKKILFWGIVTPVVLTSLYIAVATVYLNFISVTKGPVHWHADYRILNCGTEVDLLDPGGLANRIGTPVLHEHGDSRIHVEGAVVELADVSLGTFFKVTGGHLTDHELEVPTNDSLLLMASGELCLPGAQAGNLSQLPATLQVFVYRTQGSEVIQEKLLQPADYVPAPESVVPPGDCIIFEFTPEIKDRTEYMCNFYEIEIEKGNLKYEF